MLAVLPFENLSGDPAHEYFSEIRIPQFDPHHLARITIFQGLDDGKPPHGLYRRDHGQISTSERHYQSNFPSHSANAFAIYYSKHPKAFPSFHMIRIAGVCFCRL